MTMKTPLTSHLSPFQSMEVDTRYAPPFRGKEVKLEPKWREEGVSCQSLADSSWDGVREVARLLE